ncbi:MAG: SDR family NAD(P)-dependent oxidoreductase, partial [Bacteroidota bacterium]
NLSQQHHAYILNIASLAALSPIGYKTVYPASKAFIHNFSLGLAEELKDTNISVSVVHPGAMKTNLEVTKRVEKQGFIGKLTLLELDTIAKKCVAGLYSKKKIIVLNPFNYYIMKLLPTSLKTRLITKGVKREIHE